MKKMPDHPLTPEERELAQLIVDHAPRGEPSAALDSRILAAAHTAAMAGRSRGKPRPRWPVAIGLAASMVLAVGIAWQLRPLQEPATVAEAPGAAVQPAAEEPVASPAIGQANIESASVDAAGAAAPMPAPADARAAGASMPPPETQVRARPALPNAKGRPAQGAVSTPQRAGTAMPPAPPAPPAPAPVAPAMAREPARTFVPDEQREIAADAAVTQEVDQGAHAAASSQSAAPDEAKVAAARQVQARELDRVQATGSRLTRTDLQVPVAEDTRLAVDDWLERVRTRYGLGDAGAARQSLLLFVRDHPEEPIPGDLEPLLDE